MLRNLLIVLLWLSSSARATETRFKVVIYDTGIIDEMLPGYACEEGHKDFTGYGQKAVQKHGTNVAGIIFRGISNKKGCYIAIKVFHYEHTSISTERWADALLHVLRLRPDAMNMSVYSKMPDISEKIALKAILKRGIPLTVSAGNDMANLDERCNSYPSCYRFTEPNFIVVGSKLRSSNRGSMVDVLESGYNQCYNGICMSGTSQAAAQHMNKILRGKLK